ncbi:MAG: Outer membrane protein assembly factor BamB [Planctomycetes bacterium]|nr:Outer membrane protein assembly factor BamB [Planctomycetota bacterium]
MTSLRGNLNSVDLANIFQMLSMNQREGTLYIFDGASRKAIYFGHDGVSMLTRGKHRPDALGRILIRFDKLSPEKLAEALRSQDAAGGKLLGHVLVEQGLVTRADVEDALKTQIEEEVYSLFIWKDAQFEFVEGPPDEEFRTHDGITKLTFNVNSLIMEAAKRVDEWEWIQRVLPDTQEIFRYSGRNVALDDELFSQAWAGRILAAIDGRRSVDEIVVESYAGRFEVTKAMALLLEGGAIEPAPVSELSRAADAAMAAGDTPGTVKFLTRLVAKKADTPEMHRCLGEAHESGKELERAAFHYKVHAEILLSKGDRAAAFDVYRRIVGFLPTDLAAADRIVEIFASNPEGLEQHAKEVIELGKSAAECYVELRRPNRAVQLLHRVVSLGPEDQDLRNRLIQVYVQSGMTGDAIAEYDALGETALAVRDWDQAEKIYRKILTIDRNNEDAHAKLNQILAKRKSRQRGVRLAVAGGVLLLAAAYGGLEAYSWYRREQRAAAEALDQFRGSFATLRQKVSPLQERTAAEMRAMTTAMGDPEASAKVLLERAEARKTVAAEAENAAGQFAALASSAGEIPDAQDARDMAAGLRTRANDIVGYERRLRGSLVERLDQAWEAYDDDAWLRVHTRELATQLDRIVTLAAAAPEWIAGPKGSKAKELRENAKAVTASFDAHAAAAAEARAKNDAAGAQDAAIRFLDQWLNATGLFEEIVVPRMVTSRPAGARVLVDDAETDLRTPCILWDVHVHRPTKVKLAAEGFQTHEITFPNLRVVNRATLREDLKLSADVTMRKDVVLQSPDAGERLLAAPAVSGERIYVPSRRGLEVFDAVRGSRVTTLAIQGVCRPAAHQDRLAVAGSDRSLYFVRGSTSEIVAREPLPGNVVADPAVRDDMAWFADNDGNVTAANLRESRASWRWPAGGARGAGIQISPSLHGNELWCVAVDGRVTVLDARTGAEIRSFFVRDGGPAVAFTTPVCVAGGLALAAVRGSSDQKPSTLYAFDPSTGEIRWKDSVDGEIRVAPLAWQGVAYAVTTQGTVLSWRLGDRAERAGLRSIGARVRTDVLLADGVLYVGDVGGTLTALDVRGAAIEALWDFRLSSRDGRPIPIVTRPVQVDDRLYVCGDDRVVYALRK